MIADDSAKPSFTASDLIAQAEHDPLAMPILVALSEEIVLNTEAEIDRQLKNLPRGDIARSAFRTGEWPSSWIARPKQLM